MGFTVCVCLCVVRAQICIISMWPWVFCIQVTVDSDLINGNRKERLEGGWSLVCLWRVCLHYGLRVCVRTPYSGTDREGTQAGVFLPGFASACVHIHIEEGIPGLCGDLRSSVGCTWAPFSTNQTLGFRSGASCQVAQQQSWTHTNKHTSIQL